MSGAKKAAPWLIRTYAGFGDAAQTNERFRENLAKGQTGLSVAFDLPTQNGYDPDHPLSAGEVGGTGVAVSHLGDMRRLFEGLDLGRINTSMTINATAPWLYALYLAVAEEQGVPLPALRGTTQNDLLKEYVGRGTHIFEPNASLRLQTDLIAFAAAHTPKWNPMNACGYHYMESGATPAEEIGFAVGNAMMVLDAVRPRVSAEQFATVVEQLSFFINSGIELVPEIAKVRAYSKLWPAICEEFYGLPNMKWRAGCQVRSLTLTEQVPEVNIVRIAYQSLPVLLSAGARVRALQLPGFREATGLPDAAEQALSLRTQQVLMYETGLTDYEDIFEGSVVIERETARTMAAAREVALELRAQGFERSIGFIARRLTQNLVEASAALERGERLRVGVNAFTGELNIARKPRYEDDSAERAVGAARQVAGVAAWRAARDAGAVASAREQLEAAARSGANLVEASLVLAKAGGTTGEWTETLARAFGGRYQATIGSDVAAYRPLNLPTAARPYRVFLAKSGLDGHVNAVKLLAYACRQSGMEVIYSGLQQTPAAIVSGAVQEGAEVIGISCLSGAHLHVAREVMAALAARGISDLPVVMGGIIPDHDAATLHELGIAAVFTPKDSDVGAIVGRLIALAEGSPP